MLLCRICFQEITNHQFVSLSNADCGSELESQLNFCVPEMAIHLISEPLMCISCVSALKTAYNFKKICLETEKRIRSYIESKQVGINIRDLIHESVWFPEEPKLETTVKMEIEFPIVNETEDVHVPPLDVDPSLDKPFKCNKCSYSTADRSSYNKHQSTHSDERPYKCHICSYRCKRKDALGLHIKTHQKQKPNSCPDCEYTAVTKYCLRRHIMSSHLHLRPFQCEQCKFSAVDRGTLVKHMISHSKIKPFQCMICTFRTSRKHTLVKHMRTHNKNRSSLTVNQGLR